MTSFVIFQAAMLLTFVSVVVASQLPTGAPERFGVDSERLARIDDHFAQVIGQEALPGAVALIVRDEHQVYLRSFGEADRETGVPMKCDAIFRLASVTKPIVSAGVLILHEEGHFLLSDPISKFIPEFANPRVMTSFDSSDGSHTTEPARREITIRDLLTHTSGIGYAMLDERLRVIYRKADIPDVVTDRPVVLADKIKTLATLPLVHHPGERWTYGLNHDVLGYLIEVVSGEPLGRFLQRRLFGPLGMTDTHFYLPQSKRNRLAALYHETSNGLRRYDQAMMDQFAPGVTPDFPVDGAQTYYSGGGGLSSTASDIARFGQMLLNGGELDGARVLSPKTLELMTLNHIGRHRVDWMPGRGYGLGVWVTIDAADTGTLTSVGSYGWDGIWNTLLWVDPQERLVGVLMMQSYPSTYNHQRFQNLVYQSLCPPRSIGKTRPASDPMKVEHYINDELVFQSGGDHVFRLLD